MVTREDLPAVQAELRPYFRSLTKDIDLADDVSQFAALKCWEHCRNNDRISLKKLMMTSGRNFYFSYRKRHRSQESGYDLRSFSSAVMGPICQMERREVVEHVSQTIRGLPKNYQEVVHRLFFLGQTYQQAALAMGKSVNTSKTWRRRAFGQLRVHLIQRARSE